MLYYLQGDIFPSYKTPEIQYGIAHTSQRCVYADPRYLCNLFERQVLEESHKDHLTLYRREEVHKLFNLYECLLVYKEGLYRF